MSDAALDAAAAPAGSVSGGFLCTSRRIPSSGSGRRRGLYPAASLAEGATADTAAGDAESDGDGDGGMELEPVVVSDAGSVVLGPRSASSVRP